MGVGVLSTCFDQKKILEAAKRLKNRRKIPTSIALEEATIRRLKKIATEKGVPYQVLMRMLIVEGMKKIKEFV